MSVAPKKSCNTSEVDKCKDEQTGRGNQRQAERQAGRKTSRQRDKQAGKETSRQRDKQAERRAVTQSHTHTHTQQTTKRKQKKQRKTHIDFILEHTLLQILYNRVLVHSVEEHHVANPNGLLHLLDEGKRHLVHAAPFSSRAVPFSFPFFQTRARHTSKPKPKPCCAKGATASAHNQAKHTRPPRQKQKQPKAEEEGQPTAIVKLCRLVLLLSVPASPACCVAC